MNSTMYEPIGLQAAAYMAARRKLGIRTKYNPHVGAKQKAKAARRARP